MDNMDKIKLTVCCGVIFIMFMLGLSCLKIVETGERGVVLRMGKFVGIMDEGLNFRIPLIDKVEKLNIREVNFSSTGEVSSKDMQTIHVDVSLIYALNPAEVGRVYQKYSTKYEETLIKPTLAEITNSIIANYPIEEFVEKRTEITNKINEAFVEKTTNSAIVVKSLLITNHDFSDEYNKAIESKKVAEQGALKAKYDLERVTLEARAQQEKQKSLSPMVLQEKAIDKWDGKLPNYYSGNNLPFLTLNK